MMPAETASWDLSIFGFKNRGKSSKIINYDITCRSPSYLFYGIYACKYTYLTFYGQQCYNPHMAFNDNFSLQLE